MLLEINIKNYIIIEQERIIFEKGLNILTGETGSGKSLVIDALGAITGGRFNKDDIRKNAEKASIEALFSIEGQADSDNGLNQILTDFGVSIEEDNTILISREVSLSGKSVCRINGQTVTLSMLKKTTENIMDIVGQNEHQLLLNINKHIDYLDSFDIQNIKPVKNQINLLVSEIREQQKRLDEVSGDAGERERRLDLLKFQIEDINQANLIIDEDKILKSKRIKLINAEKLIRGINLVYQKIYMGDKQVLSAIDVLNDCVHSLEELSLIDSNLQKMKEAVENSVFSLEDIKTEIREYSDEINFSPEEIAECEERLDIINKIKRKYGSTIEDVLAYKEEINTQYEKLINSEQLSNELNKKIEQFKDRYYTAAAELSRLREKSAKKMEQLIEKELFDLNMSGARFVINFKKDALNISANGIDKVEFLLSPNPGESEKPLIKIASGGEISRVMLAIKNVLIDSEKLPCVIFDEVDAGIGGMTAKMVGQKIKYISEYSQVICITHLPQIASYADTHIYIDKIVKDEKTYTKIRTLEEKERVVEIARMIGGNEDEKTSINHAKEMIKASK